MAQPPLYITPIQKAVLDAGFTAAFGAVPTHYFSAPGRTEIGGNHTDHQRGRVLAGAVDLDIIAAVRPNGTETIRVHSKGYPGGQIRLADLTPDPEEFNTTLGLIRGVAAGFSRLGHRVQGFDAYCESTVLPGSGLSSSAAYEVLMGTIVNHLFCAGQVSAPQVAQIGQYAENVFFGKPCGLMDQTASAVGNLVSIDFADPAQPVIHPVDCDFSACGHALCIVDTCSGHADLTGEYAAIPGEMKQVCDYFGKDVLSQIPEADFFAALPRLRGCCSDRAILRAIHFYRDNARVVQQVAALERGDFDTFLHLVTESGRSSWMYLQNVIPAGSIWQQPVALALMLCEQLLQGSGAFRVHGGGFAGTVQAFVPNERLEAFRRGIDAVLGNGACHVLHIRPQGGVPLHIQ